MDEPTVAAWVERYVRAWETNDPAAIGDLFAEHALYYPAPDTEPWRDRDGIVAGWLERKDEPGTWSFRYQVLGVAADLAFVRGWTHYLEPPSASATCGSSGSTRPGTASSSRNGGWSTASRTRRRTEGE